MKYFTTFTQPVAGYAHLLLLLLLFLFASVSFADAAADSLNKDSQKYLSFYETVDGERIHWEVNFLGDKITSIYKNGEKIPDDLAADYKEKVYDQLDDMRSGGKKFSFQMPGFSGKEFHFDMEELHKGLEELKKDLPKHKEHFKFYQFDSQEFEKEMEELKEELEKNKSKIYEWKFDKENFKEQMEKFEKDLKENLPKLKKFKLDFDWEDEDDEV